MRDVEGDLGRRHLRTDHPSYALYEANGQTRFSSAIHARTQAEFCHGRSRLSLFHDHDIAGMATGLQCTM